MGHGSDGSAGIYLSSFPEKLLDKEVIDKKLDKMVATDKRKEYINKVVKKITNIFKKEKKAE